MINEELIEGLKQLAHTMKRDGDPYFQRIAEDAIKALEQTNAIDKIREEIEELKNAPPCFDDMFEYKCAVDDVLAIINNYKVESEDKG